jgi:hypothetical protein
MKPEVWDLVIKAERDERWKEAREEERREKKEFLWKAGTLAVVALGAVRIAELLSRQFAASNRCLDLVGPSRRLSV